MPPFSRMQLAAALIEYDNDPDDPSAPFRSAEESAIFLFLRNRNNPRDTIMGYDAMPRRSVDFLKVSIPGEDELAQEGRKSELVHSTRKSQDIRRSMEALKRPSSEIGRLNETMFRDDGLEDEEEEIEGTPDLNLASWGVDKFLAKEEPRPQSRASSINALTRGVSPGPSMRPPNPSNPSLGVAGVTLEQRGENRRIAGSRAKSLGDWGMDRLKDGEADEHGNAFSSVDRPRRSSVADPAELAAQNEQPPVSFRKRSSSLSGMQSIALPGSASTPHPSSIPAPSPTHTSFLDPQAITHQRDLSMASVGSKYVATMGDERKEMARYIPTNPPNAAQRYSRNLIRPKLLVMPSLLQEQEPVADTPKRPVREGFLDSTDSRPLPPGAKTNRASSYGALNPGNRSSMTLSQITFRNSLMVGGQRDPSFADLESRIKRAEHEGEMIPQEHDIEPEVEEDTVPLRAAGKLYGRSLIDDLEARKTQLKNKQRVFRGDERPSMMQRPQMMRGDTLISEQDLQGKARMADNRPVGMRNPLINIADDPIPGTNVRPRPQMGRSGSGLAQSRSVFGVDQVWEKELAKLKQIEAIEKAEEEERKKEEAVKRKKEEERAAKKAAKKGKGKRNSMDMLNTFAPADEDTDHLPKDNTPIRRTPATTPLLPEIDSFPIAASREDGPTSSDSEEETNPQRSQNRIMRSTSRQDWLSDDERPAVPRPRKTVKVANDLKLGDDSDSDVPLTAALTKAKQKQQAEDSEEDKPLSTVLKKTASTFDFGGTVLANMMKPNESVSNRKTVESDEDDDKPLGLQHPGARLTMLAKSAGGNSDDDEQPLGMRYSMAPSQMFMQQQQQQMMQQQMMAAAQMQSTMFNPMFMGGTSGIGTMHGMGMGFPNSMTMPMMNPGMVPMGPMDMPEPEIVPDAAKIGRVDRWRRDVGNAAES